MSHPIFDVEYKTLTVKREIHVIHIQNFTSQISGLIDRQIVEICEGMSGSDISIIKQRLRDYFSTKKGSTLYYGSVAEFMIHLYLREIGFKQECLFLNLEEGSIKKGFDGYYSLMSEEWILESKSGLISTTGISHPSKIKEAYKDLSEKFTNIDGNNPWKNAYNHASHADVATSASIRANLKKMSDLFINKKATDIKKMNIITCSTIFYQNNWQANPLANFEAQIKGILKEFNFKKINIVCVNKNSVDAFINYLNK